MKPSNPVSTQRFSLPLVDKNHLVWKLTLLTLHFRFFRYGLRLASMVLSSWAEAPRGQMPNMNWRIEGTGASTPKMQQGLCDHGHFRPCTRTLWIRYINYSKVFEHALLCTWSFLQKCNPISQNYAEQPESVGPWWSLPLGIYERYFGYLD